MSTKKIQKVSVITVNYNVAKHIKRLICSLKKIDKIIKEIIVVDNNSNDVHSLEKGRKIVLIKNKTNFGFAKAVNQGIKVSKCDIILLINPDCYLENTSILSSLNKIFSDKNIGAIGGRLTKPAHKGFQFSANNKANFLTGIFEFTNLKKLFPENKYTKMFWVEKNRNIKHPIKVESLCGANIIFRKSLDNKLNIFDERYFLYMEDMDFGNKINSLGYKVIFNPSSEIVHIGGKSSGSKYGTVLKHWYKSRKIYFKKHLNIVESSILSLIFTIEELLLYIFHKIKNTSNV
ncbi:MAG: Glycosyl transferase family 2 [Microgenomates group bacterium GW2011_GWA2_40_6]|nr:MAG: Glycosyl transferase family 2 [Microgenomates group bacterium GW2011_GWA2_40_6]